MQLDYLHHLERESARFESALVAAPADAAVPSCPDRSVRITTTDTGRSWLVTLGRFRGTRPADGQPYDEPTLDVEDDPSGGERRPPFGAERQRTSTARCGTALH